MWSTAHRTARSILWCFFIGTIASGLKALLLHYPQQGLYRLALGVWTETLPSYLVIGLVCGLLADGLWRGRARLKRLGSGGPIVSSALDLGAWLVASYPIFVWLVAFDDTLSPISRGHGVPILGVLLIPYLAGFFLLRRRNEVADHDGPIRAPTAKPMIGLAVLLPAVAFAVRASDELRVLSPAHRRSPPNILLIVLDTVRADRLSSYGYERATSPELDAFCSESIRFDDFYSTSSWTVPSHSSLFTGFFPIRHGATQEQRWLASRFVTLAEKLRNHGFTTWAASANPNVSRHINLDQGFEVFLETWRHEHQRPGSYDAVGSSDPHPNNRAFLQFLEQTPRDRPFFAFINYIDAHVPLFPPRPFLERFLEPGVDPAYALALGRKRSHEHYIDEPYGAHDLEILSDLYDGEIAYLSQSVGRLLDAFRQDPRFEESLIVITSDHGEHFGEQDLLGHMFGLYNTTVRVPLLIRLPGGERGGEVESLKGQLVDLYPTLLNAVGVSDSDMERKGIDLLHGGSVGRDAILSEYYYPIAEFDNFDQDEYSASKARLAPFMRRLRAIELYGYRFIWSSNGQHELYNVLRDPGEGENLLIGEDPPPIAQQLERELASAFQGLLDEGEADPMSRKPARGSAGPELDPQTRDALQALGYVR